MRCPAEWLGQQGWYRGNEARPLPGAGFSFGRWMPCCHVSMIWNSGPSEP